MSVFDIDKIEIKRITPEYLESNGYKCTFKSKIASGRYEFVKRIEPFSQWVQLRVNIWGDTVTQYQLEKFPPGENCRILYQTRDINNHELLILEEQAKSGTISLLPNI
jgi:hypothetical protein